MSASANEGQRRENRSSENEEEEEEGVGEYGIGIAKRLSGDRASATSGFCGRNMRRVVPCSRALEIGLNGSRFVNIDSMTTDR